MEIVAYRGLLISEDIFIKRLQERGEITTQDILDKASIACFKSRKMDPKSPEVQLGIRGIGSGEITLVRKDRLIVHNAVITADSLPDFKKHALMSGISAQDTYRELRASGVHFVHVEK